MQLRIVHLQFHTGYFKRIKCNNGAHRESNKASIVQLTSNVTVIEDRNLFFVDHPV